MKTLRYIMIPYSIVATTICMTGFLIDYDLLSGVCVLINGVALYFWCKLEA